MTDGMAGLPPEMLPWVQIRATGRDVAQVEERMIFDEPADFVLVSSRAIQQGQNSPSGKTADHLVQEMNGVLTSQLGQRQGTFVPANRDGCAIRMKRAALRRNRNNRGFAARLCRLAGPRSVQRPILRSSSLSIIVVKTP